MNVQPPDPAHRGSSCSSNTTVQPHLTPPQPPGRVTRKARAFEAEISRLRAQGYSLDAIRQALAAAGVLVSISTVRREALRSAPATSTVSATHLNLPSHAPAAIQQAPARHSRRAEPAFAQGTSGACTGHEVAKAWMETCIANPLLRATAAATRSEP